MICLWLFAALMILQATARPVEGSGECLGPVLQLVYPNITSDIQPGDLLPIEDLTESPRLYLLYGQLRTQTYLALMVHPDININGTLLDLVHWIQPDLQIHDTGDLRPAPELTVNNDINSSSSTSAIPRGTPYLPPNPPASLGVQEYFFYLFAQPPTWTFPPSFAGIDPPADLEARIGFEMDRFLRESGLAAVPLASTFVRTRNE